MTTNLIDLLELDAEVLHEYLRDAVTWVLAQAAAPPRRILDLGSGTGTGAVALARQVEGAEVIAVDASAEHLSRLTGKAQPRISTLLADLDVAWPDLDPVDLVWASMSMHHMADPDRVLRDIHRTLRPGGLLAVAEISRMTRFLPAPLADLEERCHAAVAADRAHAMPYLGADWARNLERAGFTTVTHRTFDIALPPPHPAATARYAEGSLQRMRAHLDNRLPAADLTALDTVIAGLRHRDDLIVRGTRTVWVAS